MGTFFQQIKLRFWLLWCVLCGRKISLYTNILQGKPTAYRMVTNGLKAEDNAMVIECIVSSNRDEFWCGIFVGEGSTVVGCAVMNMKGHGYGNSSRSPELKDAVVFHNNQSN